MRFGAGKINIASIVLPISFNKALTGFKILSGLIKD